jgi:hypothetical protein
MLLIDQMNKVQLKRLALVVGVMSAAWHLPKFICDALLLFGV